MARINNQCKGIKGQREYPPIDNEWDHFYRCPHCNQPVDKRDLGQVVHHNDKDHKPLDHEEVNLWVT